MLTIAEYNDLWIHNPCGMGSFATITGIAVPPPYADYVIRENMLEDYLDIFRGINTRHIRQIIPVGGWYYEHPFFNADGTFKLKEKPCIKYLMIGEAAPKKNISSFNLCVGDQANTYFYNLIHIGTIVGLRKTPTPWLNAPRITWGCPPFQECPSNKFETLICLASKGVLLLDIFPFSISYNTRIRRNLNHFGITSYFWNNHLNPYNLESRIMSINHLLCDKWDLCMVAPNTISEFIVDPINGFPELSILPPGLHVGNFRDILPDVTRPNDWRKIAVTIGGSPSSHLISVAF
ncbi:MAG: hypothetical protein ACOYLP_04215 [Flavobacterium sp.]|uniref:hypothetical protein n=1 Tax=Flavobacterium sp. TaxID=239 RepID=UPI003BD52292